MPEHTPTGAVDVVQRQVRRVRRRKNLFELQRSLYWGLAVATLTAALLLPLALFGSGGAFATAAWGALTVLGLFLLALVAATHRRWIGHAQALGWIETQSPLAGRVRTLVELATRPDAARGFFHPLLVAEVRRDLDDWTPHRVIPRAVPRAPLAAALAALVALFAVTQLASFTTPAAPAVAFSKQPLAGEQSAPPDDAAIGDRVVIAPGVPPEDGDASSPVRENEPPSRLSDLSSRLQENVRQQVWGKAWERVRDALAHAGTNENGASGESDEQRDTLAANDASEGETKHGPNGDGSPRRQPGVGKQAAGDDDDDDAATDEKKGGAGDNGTGEAASEDSGGAGGSGAGNGTSPNLFGGSSVDPSGSGSFELALAARMRADGKRGRRGTGAAGPSADPDAKPALGSEQRRESAAHRMTVPAAYETVVREVFAHRRAGTERP